MSQQADADRDFDRYTAEQIVWRTTCFVNGEPMTYVAQLGFAYGYGGLFTLEVYRADGMWKLSVEGHYKVGIVRGYASVVEAQDVAVALAAQILQGMIDELSHLITNTVRERSGRAIPARKRQRRNVRTETGTETIDMVPIL